MRIHQVPFKHLTIEQNCSVVICSIIICSNSISSEGMLGNYYILQNSWFGSGRENCQGLEKIITSFGIHGLDQLWFG